MCPLENVDRARHHELREFQHKCRMHSIQIRTEMEAERRKRKEERRREDIKGETFSKAANLVYLLAVLVILIVL